MKTILLIISMIACSFIYGQGVSINDNGLDPNPFSILDVNSSIGLKGMLIPRMTWANAPVGLGATEDGMLIYCTDGDGTNPAGFYYWNGIALVWNRVATTNMGTINYLPRWTPDGFTFGLSKIQDDGTTIGINTAPNASYILDLNGGTLSGLNVLSSGIGVNNYGIYTNSNGLGTTNYGIYSEASGAATNWAGYFNGNVYMTGNVGINQLTPYSALDIVSSASGLLIPRMTNATILGLTVGVNQNSMLVYQTDLVSGYYYYDHPTTTWRQLLDNKTGWMLTGNSNTNSLNDYIGTSDLQNLSIRTNAIERIHVTSAGLVGVNMTATNAQFESTTNSTTADFAAIKGSVTGIAKVYGVLGTTNSTTTNASGVRGYASGITGMNNGLFGESASTDGSGVFGIATEATSVNTVGVYGSAILGTGVFGATSGTGGWGVWGHASGDNSYGVFGSVASTAGTVNMGVIGDASGATTNFGVYSNQAMGVAEWTGGVLVSGTYNDLAISDAGFLYCTRTSNAAGSSTLTGFAGGTDGRILILHINNTSTRTIVIAHENAGSTAANRIRINTFANLTSTAKHGTSAMFIYSGTLSRWILISWLP